MSEKELRRAEVLARVKAGELKLGNAAELMEVSYGQSRRLWKRYREYGAAGLQHRSAGRRSHRAKAVGFRAKVLGLVRRKYGGKAGERLGPTLAAEHLESDDGLKVDHETLRRWMLAEGLWSRERKRQQHRKRRERKPHFGDLVQLDGSFHEWLAGSEEKQCLMNMVDDATGKTLSQLHQQETTWAAVDVLRAWVEKYGVPHALYTDWKNVYLREPTAKERLRGEAPLTQFGRMCGKLGVAIIGASSPQAKGRVERSNGTQQDRLIKKLRLYRMRTMPEANRYLRQHYLPDHNRRFSREPIAAEDYHRKRPNKRKLDAIFRLEEQRIISSDWVVQYQGRLLQIERESRYAPAGGKVLVSEDRQGRLAICYRSRPVKWREIPKPGPASPPRAKGRALELRKKVHQPADAHPWKQCSPSWLQAPAAGNHTATPSSVQRLTVWR
jgi:transposase-like protein